MSQYEIEIKSLLKTKERADSLKENLAKNGFNIKNPKKSIQLNHYFLYKGLDLFCDNILPYVPIEKKTAFTDMIKNGNNFSIRTRKSNDKVLLVVKASLNTDSSSNGVVRMEFEIEVSISLRELDQILLDSGFNYQAKWSREREEYNDGDITVCIDKNAGYGYIVEFEKVVDDKSQVDDKKNILLSFMKDIGVEELPQERLERMFSYYNEHWSEYYGTDKTFIIE